MEDSARALGVSVAVAELNVDEEVLEEISDVKEDDSDKLISGVFGKDEDAELKVLETTPVESNVDEGWRVEPLACGLDADPDPSVRKVYPLERIDDEGTTVELLTCELEAGDAAEPKELETTWLELGRAEAETVELPTCKVEVILVEANELEIDPVSCDLEAALAVEFKKLESDSIPCEVEAAPMMLARLELEPAACELENIALETREVDLETATCIDEAAPIELALEPAACELDTDSVEIRKVELGKPAGEDEVPLELREFGVELLAT